MGFASGSINFRRYAVLGKDAPDMPSEKLLERLDELALRPGEIGVPEPIEWGWSGGRHVLDSRFSFEHNVYNDCLYFALRIDTNKVPGEMKKAYQVIEEEAVAKGNPSGFISKTQKREVKDTVSRKLDEDLKSGRFRRSKLLHVLWDLPNRTLYCAASNSDQEKLCEHFERSFGLTLQLLSSGTVALRKLESAGKRRDYEDLKPTRFVVGPAGEGQSADYPWVSKCLEKNDFLGNEFLLWLWHEADNRTGIIATAEGDVTVMFDKSLDLDCVFGENGKDSLRGAGPTRMPEAIHAVRSGKAPRKAGLIMDAHSQQYTLTLGAELLAVSGLQLPNIEDADTPRAFFEERIDQLRDFSKASEALFDAFLKLRIGGGWETHVGAIRQWIHNGTRRQAAA
jgi:hypothetical protein